MILLSPHSKAMRNGKLNPKNYPYWQQVVEAIGDHNFVQIGVQGEQQYVSSFYINLSFKQIMDLVIECQTWVSVDNFLPHLAHHTGKPGIVVWGPSDPLIYGYPENINLLKSRDGLRQKQFDIWEAIEHNPNIFPDPEVVIAQILRRT